MEPLHEQVLSYVKQNGPVVPTQVAKMLGRETYVAGAILSDLLSRKELKISSAKLGGSPVYYTPDQKEKLSLLYQHLPQREKEAYDLLKEKKVINDNDLEPAIHVAFRMLRDFAIPMDMNNTTVWRWYLTPEEEAHAMLQQKQLKPQEFIQQTITPTPPRKAAKDETFSTLVSAYLSSTNIAVTGKISERKNKELILTARVPSAIGELDMLIVAKNKAKISNNDLTLAYEKGAAKKLPTLFLVTGELAKKARQHIEKNLRGYLFLKKIP